MARLTFKRAVTKIIVKIQAYKFNLYILRTQACKQSIKKILPNMPEHHQEDDIFFGEDYYDEDDHDSDADELDDPYLEAERLGRIKTKKDQANRKEYMLKNRQGSPFLPKEVLNSQDIHNEQDPFGSSQNSKVMQDEVVESDK